MQGKTFSFPPSTLQNMTLLVCLLIEHWSETEKFAKAATEMMIQKLILCSLLKEILKIPGSK